MYYKYNIFFADVYGSDVYGTGAYQEVQGTSTSPLANTGYDVIIPVALGISVVAASIFVLIKKLYARKQQNN